MKTLNYIKTRISWYIYVLTNLFIDVPDVYPGDRLYYEHTPGSSSFKYTCKRVYFSFKDGIWFIEIEELNDFSISWGVEKFYRYEVNEIKYPDDKKMRKTISLFLILLLIYIIIIS